MLEQSARSRHIRPACAQLLDLGFPFTLGEQGPFVARGIPAVTLTASRQRRANRCDAVRRAAFERCGSGARRASQNLIGSLDAGLELAQGTTSAIYLGTRIIRGGRSSSCS